MFRPLRYASLRTRGGGEDKNPQTFFVLGWRSLNLFEVYILNRGSAAILFRFDLLPHTLEFFEW